MANFVMGMISLVISAIIVATVVIPTFKNANTTAFSTGEVALWGLLSLVTIAGLLYGVLSIFGLG